VGEAAGNAGTVLSRPRLTHGGLTNLATHTRVKCSDVGASLERYVL